MSRLTTFATKIISRGSDCPDQSFARVAIRTKLARSNLIPATTFYDTPAHGLMYGGSGLDLLLEKLCLD